MDTTGKALVDFWNWVGEKGLMKGHTAQNYRVACMQVLSVMDDWETIDVCALDTDEVFGRFVNLKGREFKPRSLQDYRGRFRQAVKSYLSYARDPAAWKPHVQSDEIGAGKKGGASSISRSKRSKSETVTYAEAKSSKAARTELEVSQGPYYRWGLLNGGTAELRASRRLTVEDLDMLQRYVDLLKLAADGDGSRQSKNAEQEETNR
jgi:hypothetical protein